MAKSSTSKFYGTSRTKNNGHKTRREIVKDFVSEWTNKGKDTGYGFIKEDANRQPFIDDFLRRVCGIEQPTKYIEYEKDVQVKDGDKTTTKRIDGYVPSTKVMWEMKGSNKSLTDKIEQSGGKKLTPFEQAWRYSEYLPQSEKPRWIIISNFTELDIHDMDHLLDEPKIIKISELTTKYKSFDFIVDTAAQKIIDEKKLSVDAGALVSKIYKELERAYSLHADLKDKHIQNSLNMLIVRLVFLLYADDTGILGDENLFQQLLENEEPDNIRQTLITLFDTLNTPEDERDGFLANKFKVFKYVNGGMFADNKTVIPQFTDELKDLIVNDAGKGFDWSNISPTIFGAVFESTLNPETRREGGMHYTSLTNIHKVIDPLFLDSLKKEFNHIKDIPNSRDRVDRAFEFQDKLAKLKFLDPACGSGNFLTETYLSLRRLENECLLIIVGNNSALNLDSEVKVKIKIQNFYGIEINDFAVSVARTAMWIAESQMWDESQNIIYSREDFLPLDSNDSIYEGNALTMDWKEIVKPYDLNYIMGNPPFIGANKVTKAGKKELADLFGKNSKSGLLDYVAGWYWKAVHYIDGTTIKVAFVSTDSITQGEQPHILWTGLIGTYNISINFAYTTFKWDNEASNVAKIDCVIVSFSQVESHNKFIYHNDGSVEQVKHINPYIYDYDKDTTLSLRTRPICNVPKITKGNQPTDGGNLIISAKEYPDFIKENPDAKPWIKRLVGSDEYIKGKNRYCLWLVDITPAELRKISGIRKRVEACRTDRMTGGPDKKKLVDTPHLFREQMNPDSYLIIPSVSGPSRKYIPIGFLDGDTIPTNLALIIMDANNYEFGILESIVHMAWMRIVAGRKGISYRYSKKIVYNDFPWPEIDDTKKQKISETAKGILDARNLYQDSSLADLYDPVTMPIELKKAHEKNDKAVLDAYGLKADATEKEIVHHLFGMYEKLVKENK